MGFEIHEAPLKKKKELQRTGCSGEWNPHFFDLGDSKPATTDQREADGLLYRVEWSGDMMRLR